MYWKTDCAILVLKKGNRNIIGASVALLRLHADDLVEHVGKIAA